MRQTLIGILALALAGCGGASKDEPEQELSGVLQAGNISGVSYSTPTRSGATDASGTFKYLAGETVTFSIGAIQLGSARGSTAVTAFTLAGLTPPTTEMTLRGELDRARREATPFTRAVNIQYLLMSLDADHDPANGLDVGAQAGALANASIDLGLPVSSFAGKVQYIAPNVTRNIPVARAVVQLYRAMNIRVLAHVSSRDTTTDSSGVFSSAAFTSFGADGSRTTTGSDFDNDGRPEAQYTYGYDKLGRITSVDGLQQSLFQSLMYRYTYEYNAAGTMTGGNEDYDLYGDGITDIRYRHNLTVDSQGQRTGDQIDLDNFLDGVIDGRQVVAYRYDSRHNMTLYTADADYDFNGVVDERVRYTTDFDARDRATGAVYEIDSNADGIADLRYTDTFVSGSGAHPVRAVSESDNDADGTPDYRENWLFTYDRDRRMLSYYVEQDYDADGTIDYRERQVTTFDVAGNAVASQVDYLDGEGNIEFQSFTDCRYGTGGERLDCSSSSMPSGSTDPQPQSTLSVQNEIFADGVLALAQFYLGN